MKTLENVIGVALLLVLTAAAFSVVARGVSSSLNSSAILIADASHHG